MPQPQSPNSRFYLFLGISINSLILGNNEGKMIIKFNNHYLEKLFENRPVTGKPKYANDVIRKFKKAVLKLQFAEQACPVSGQEARLTSI